MGTLLFDTDYHHLQSIHCIFTHSGLNIDLAFLSVCWKEVGGQNKDPYRPCDSTVNKLLNSSKVLHQ